MGIELLCGTECQTIVGISFAETFYFFEHHNAEMGKRDAIMSKKYSVGFVREGYSQMT